MPEGLPVAVAALYCFVPLDDLEAKRAEIETLCRKQLVRGTILIAHEGINGTIAGEPAAVQTVVTHLAGICAPFVFDTKYSRAATLPFYRTKVRIRREIVTMGVEGLDPTQAGTYVEPSDWNALASDPDTILIDTRNDYEVAIGSFTGAISPNTTSFREFPEWFRANRDGLAAGRARPKIAMFCTGGIRCEKATAFLKSEGLDDVYHLKGGILKYLETVPESESRWTGECFVFDERVAVGHGLALGETRLCRACRHPLSAEDCASPLYHEGTSCPACHASRDAADRARYAERHKQVALAEKRGEKHIGQRARVASGGAAA